METARAAWSLSGFQTAPVAAFPGNHTVLYMKRAGITGISALSAPQTVFEPMAFCFGRSFSVDLLCPTVEMLTKWQKERKEKGRECGSGKKDVGPSLLYHLFIRRECFARGGGVASWHRRAGRALTWLLPLTNLLSSRLIALAALVVLGFSTSMTIPMRVSRSVSTSRVFFDPLHPMTLSLSQCSKLLRCLISSGLFSMLVPHGAFAACCLHLLA